MKTLALLALLGFASACQSSGASTHSSHALPWTLQSEGWRSDKAWYDGTAEKCVYRATRSIYGQARTYLATAYTNKQFMDQDSSTKSATAQGVEVFKQHWSERVETEKYDYDFSTASFTTTADLAPFKLTVATQEDCGASFKQIWREGSRMRSLESVYFPGAGVTEGWLQQTDFVFEDALSLVLRDFPFGEQTALALRVLPSQKSTKQVSFVPRACRVVPRGSEELALPAGNLKAWRLDLQDAASGELLASYWFALESQAPWMHTLLQYQGRGGVSYRLESLKRTAYWKR